MDKRKTGREERLERGKDAVRKRWREKRMKRGKNKERKE